MVTSGSTRWPCGTPCVSPCRWSEVSHVDVVHGCNPPDALFLVALLLRPAGARFVFDHHDLVPELFQSRFPGGGRPLYWLTRALERLTFLVADGVISTNESYRDVAIRRGHVSPDKVVVVRSGPDLSPVRSGDVPTRRCVGASVISSRTWA